MTRMKYRNSHNSNKFSPNLKQSSISFEPLNIPTLSEPNMKLGQNLGYMQIVAPKMIVSRDTKQIKFPKIKSKFLSEKKLLIKQKIYFENNYSSHYESMSQLVRKEQAKRREI